MDASIRKQFKDFVNSQPDGRLIDHYLFDTCSVGDFTKEVLKRKREHATSIALTLFTDTERRLVGSADYYKILHTYKEMKDFVNEWTDV